MDGFVQVFIAVLCGPIVSFGVSVVLLVSFRCFNGFGGFVSVFQVLVHAVNAGLIIIMLHFGFIIGL